jgi:small subunit ribosomal protein S16
LAVTIRLKRIGKRGQPFYRVVATDSRVKRGGPEKEVLGTYNPRAKENTPVVVMNRDRVKYWLDVGAQVSDTIASILKKEGMLPARLSSHRGARN